MAHGARCLVGMILGCTGSALAQGSPPHPLFPEPGEPGASPLVACNLLPEQLAASDAPESLWNANLWPGGVVPYEFDAAVTQQNRDRTRIALNELETYANVRFVPRTTETNAIRVQNGGGNNSFVGRVGGVQALNMVSWSFRYIICHEFLHALGVWHEQQRSDRETFVTIVSANIQSGYEGNFTIRSSGAPVGPFDFESIMLYDDCSFSTCCAAGSTCNCIVSCATILAQPAFASQQNLMGNRNYLSQGDKDGMVSRYGAPVDDAYEENDSFATAATFASGATENLRLLDTADYFRITLAQSGLISASFSSNVWSSSNVAVSIHSTGGAQLATAMPTDPDGDGIFVANPTFSTSAGNYIIRVQRSQPWGGDYTLTLNPACDGIDFNRDLLAPDSGDLDDFVAVLAGGPSACSTFPTPGCSDVDFNNDGFSPDSLDLDAFLSRLAGGPCL
jgi:hypothetical protein